MLYYCSKALHMKKILLLLAASSPFMNARSQSADYQIRPVSFTQVRLTDSFWNPRIERNRTATIPASFMRCESTGRVQNFVMAALKKGRFGTKFPFDDTDIYKTIEGASFSLAVHPDAELERYVDALIDTVARAQEPDGYLYTARTIDSLHPHEWSGNDRWVKEHELSHELYNSGHLFEAAAAHYLATGRRNLLDVALKNADLLVRTFGPGKREVAPGHEIVEMGLVKLYRITGRTDYLQLAKFFIDARGKRAYDKNSTDEWKNGKYWQDDKPVADQDDVEGHAVRAMYLYSAVTDVAALTGDQQYIAAMDRLWNNMVDKKMYVQGGIGAVPAGERFGEDYELPNGTAYNETCAAIGDVYWNQRMFLLHGESKYIDLMEKVLYNGMLSGVGLDGKSFFYTNAMQVTNGFRHDALERQRSGWFECSCCPTNILRLLPSLPGYLYAQKDRELYINLFASSRAAVKMADGPVEVVQENNYPWDGHLSFTLNPASSQTLTVRIRIPGWARDAAIPSSLYSFVNRSGGEPIISVNGERTPYKIEGGYAVLQRVWKKGDKIRMLLDMPVREVRANDRVGEDAGKVAIQRGPLMYCLEWKDNGGRVSDLSLPAGVQLQTEARDGQLGKITVLKGEGIRRDSATGATTSAAITMIPYYAWANRGEGEMAVWIKKERRAPAARVSKARHSGPTAISPDLFGVFFEDISYAADGGLYGELVQNRSFEYGPADRKGWNPLTAWEYRTEGFGYGNLTVGDAAPLHANNPHYVVLTVEDPGQEGIGLTNGGYDGMAFRAGGVYNFSAWIRQLSDGSVPVEVQLRGKKGVVLGRAGLSVQSRGWQEYRAAIGVDASEDSGYLVVLAKGKGKLALDQVSLFPEQTFRRRANGMRDDLAQAIADLHPKFMRFPGGCLVHGDGLGNMYRWKNTIGPAEQRLEQKNIWNYHQSAGLGFFEYFQFCEDIGAKPVPIVAAGVSCQNSGGTWRIGSTGQKGIPMDEMQQYIQDVLDLIEYANGPESSEWGAKRAAAGHPAPFHLQYIGIGNEDRQTDAFRQRFRMIYAAVHAKYPNVTVIGTVGPSPAGEDFDLGWQFADSVSVAMVDEHYYEKPEWFLANGQRYDGYDRSRSKVYVGEYASWDNTLYNALAEGAYMTSLERNGDVVHMASYAPLLANVRHTSWNPNLIYFSNTGVIRTVNYYVQQLFAGNAGDIFYPGVVAVRSGDTAVATSCVKDSRTGDIILKVVHTGPGALRVAVDLTTVGKAGGPASRILLTGTPEARNDEAAPATVVPKESNLEVSKKFTLDVPPYSLQVIRIGKGKKQ